MLRIEKILKERYDLETSIYGFDHIYSKNSVMVCTITAPHSGNGNRWMVRIAPAVSFDRWANSCSIEEFFETVDDVVRYLEERELDIYKELLKDLSSEYEIIDSL